jgi:hypothetical protein
MVSLSSVHVSRYRDSLRINACMKLTESFTKRLNIWQRSQLSVSETCSAMLITLRAGSLSVLKLSLEQESPSSG